jgi:hypothetical protein
MTPEMESRLRLLVAEQPTPHINSIIQALGNVATRRTIRNWCLKLGLPYTKIRGTRIRMTPGMKNCLSALVAERPLASYNELAQKMGDVPKPETLRRHRIRLGLPNRGTRGRPSKMTPELEARLRSLVAESPLATYQQLSIALQISIPTAMRWVKRLRIPHQVLPKD